MQFESGGQDLNSPDASLTARLLEQTARAIYDVRGPNQTHPGQWAVLRFLSIAGRHARTVGSVARYLGVSHAPASRAVAALVKRKLVKKSRDPEDSRLTVLELTEAGRSMLKDDPIHRLTALIKDLPGARQKALVEALEAVLEQLTSPSSQRTD